MFSFTCKKVLLLRPNPRFLDASPSPLLLPHIGRNTPPAAAAEHYFSTESENEDGGKGLLCCSPPDSSNPESSSVVGFATEKIEVTKTLLKRYGFTHTHLSKLYNCRPQLFTDFHPEKTLLPKLDYLRGTVGFSNTDLPRFICSNPTLLGRSLQKQILPVYSFMKALLLSDEIVLDTLKRNPRILGYSLEKRIAPNIASLRAAGVPHKQILYLMRHGPSVLVSLCLGESIKRAAEMGFHPNKLSFVDAITMFTEMSKSTWDKKIEVYHKCGLSDEETLKAFRSNPKIMSCSEGKIEKTMDFVVNKMGYQPACLSRYPSLLNYSLEKRIIPRCTFVKYLQAEGLLLRKNVSLHDIIRPKEKNFRDKFVNKYKIDVPDLMDIYLGKFSPNSNTS